MNNLKFIKLISYIEGNKSNYWKVERKLGVSVKGSNNALILHFEDWEYDNKVVAWPTSSPNQTKNTQVVFDVGEWV